MNKRVTIGSTDPSLSIGNANDDDESKGATRVVALSLAGITGLAALAGCGGNAAEDDPTGHAGTKVPYNAPAGADPTTARTPTPGTTSRATTAPTTPSTSRTQAAGGNVTSCEADMLQDGAGNYIFRSNSPIAGVGVTAVTVELMSGYETVWTSQGTTVKVGAAAMQKAMNLDKGETGPHGLAYIAVFELPPGTQVPADSQSPQGHLIQPYSSSKEQFPAMIVCDVFDAFGEAGKVTN